MPIKVVIADDHEVVRRGLVSLLAGSEVKIVGEAASGDEAVKMTKKMKPDVVLLDIRMQGKDGLAALERIRAETPGVRAAGPPPGRGRRSVQMRSQMSLSSKRYP